LGFTANLRWLDLINERTWKRARLGRDTIVERTMAERDAHGRKDGEKGVVCLWGIIGQKMGANKPKLKRALSHIL
jgi:hypothetical protein